MKRDEVIELLVDYAEGHLRSEKKKFVETILEHSSQAREDLEIIKKAYLELSRIEVLEVPSHYFTNLLPKLRQNIIEKNIGKRNIFPAWVETLLKPLAAFMIIASMIGLYDILEPHDPTNEMYSLVSEINQNSLSDLTRDLSFYGNETGLNSSIVNESQSEMLASEIITSNRMYDNIVNDRQLLSQLDDAQIEYILEQLHSVQ